MLHRTVGNRADITAHAREMGFVRQDSRQARARDGAGTAFALPSENGGRAFDLEGRVLLADFIRHGAEPPEELEPGVLLKGAVHHFYAGPNSGKTWVALRFIGNAIEREQTVALFDTENGPRIIAQRLAELGIDPTQV